MEATAVPTPERLRQMTGIELRRLRRQMGLELSEFKKWRAGQLGEKVESGAFFTVKGKPLPLENLYSGTAFLICGGPSLGRLDLEQLHKRGIWTLAINNAGCAFRPNSLIIVDPPCKFHSSLWLDPYIQKFVPQGMKGYSLRHRRDNGTFEQLPKSDGSVMNACDCPNVVAYARSPCFDEDSFLSEPNVVWGVSKKWHMRTKRPRVLSSMIAALSLVHKLGFRTLFLLGCDFSMNASQPYVFEQKGDSGKAQSNNDAYATMDMMFHLLRPKFDEAGYRVYNTNPSSGLTAFDFVSYQEAIRFATDGIQQDPLKTDGWYEKHIGKAGSG